jgi:hypothetical protein
MRCSGRKSTSIIVTLVRKGTVSTPGIFGTSGRPPTSMKIFAALRSSPFTFTVFLPVKRA